LKYGKKKMKKIEIKIEEKKKSICFIDIPFEKIPEKLKSNGDKFLIISDKNVYPLFGEKLRSVISKNGDVYKFILKSGENEKNLKNIEKILHYCYENNFSRDDTILALGGGVISDISGFVSSIYMRGINFITIPTTLLAQVDASIGGKTGVNFYNKKNLIGSFYQPEFIFINFETLKTLPEREMKQGIAEIIKYGVIKNKKIFELLEKNKENIKKYLPEIVEKCVKIKGDIIKKDEKEKTGLREVLNFGHTIGHAIEVLDNYKFNHGEAIANGMVYETFIAFKLGFCEKATYERIKNIVSSFNFPEFKGKNNIDKIIENLWYDKKVRKGNLRFVLPEKIGKVKTGVVVKEEIIKKTFLEEENNG